MEQPLLFTGIYFVFQFLKKLDLINPHFIATTTWQAFNSMALLHVCKKFEVTD